MKRTFCFLAALVLIASLIALPVSAKGIENFKAGNGYLINDKNSPVTIKETAAGIQVSHGGYYKDGINWGGVAYTVPVTLNGFTAEIKLDKFPAPNDDCWFSVDFLTKPQLFQVGANYANNPGIVNLIRFNSGSFQEYGPEKWASAGPSVTNDKFKLAQGQTLTVAVNKVGDNYQLTVNGVKANTLYKDVFTGGKGYFVVSGSMKDSAADTFTYTITKINGQPTVTAETTAATMKAAATTAAKAAVTTSAKTADASVIIAAVALTAGAAIVIGKKRK